MRIALLGYGKMGKVIEKIALNRGHEIVLTKDNSNTFEGLLNADVAIDFSIPNFAVDNIAECLNNNIPIVSGTTGWLENYKKVEELCIEKNGSFIYSSNFSLGVNLFFKLNEDLAKMMRKFNQYQVKISEIHHTQKLDAPSGTAISLANKIIDNSNYRSWTLDSKVQENEIFIEAERKENIPGTHHVNYSSQVDSIEIIHTAHSREGFALGAVIAAEWLINKKGIFSMNDVLELN